MLKLLAIFATIFLAEIGDKTQVATLLYAADRAVHPLLVFAAASAALVVASGLAVLAGGAINHYLPGIPIKLLAGIGFIAIGVLTIVGHFNGG